LPARSSTPKSGSDESGIAAVDLPSWFGGLAQTGIKDNAANRQEGCERALTSNAVAEVIASVADVAFGRKLKADASKTI